VRAPGEPPRVAIVTVNFETPTLVAQLVFSLFRVLGSAEFAALVVVDNGSRDGSGALLRALEQTGLVRLIANRVQRNHGPAVTQALSWLARRQADRVDYVWVVDSDVVVLREDAVRASVAALEAAGAAAVGEAASDEEGLSDYSLLLDPALLWRPPLPPFVEDGYPSGALQRAARERGLGLAPFPFAREGFVVHAGRGTLRRLVEARHTTNRYYEWALTHHKPHFGEWPGAESRYCAFGDVFREEVPDDDPGTLVAACRRPGLARF
jgi:glycosyltransferase involved in cell wall biosynthesis